MPYKLTFESVNSGFIILIRLFRTSTQNRKPADNSYPRPSQTLLLKPLIKPAVMIEHEPYVENQAKDGKTAQERCLETAQRLGMMRIIKGVTGKIKQNA